MTPTPDIYVLHQAPDTLGESPLWDAAWWDDTIRHRVNLLDGVPGRLQRLPARLCLMAIEAPARGWALPHAHLHDAERTTTTD